MQQQIQILNEVIEKVPQSAELMTIWHQMELNQLTMFCNFHDFISVPNTLLYSITPIKMNEWIHWMKKEKKRKRIE